MSIIKEIRVQEKITVWTERTVKIVCDEKESDEDTFARLRQEGINGEAENGDQEYNMETEEAIGEPDHDSPYTYDFGDGSDERFNNPKLGVRGTYASDEEDED